MVNEYISRQVFLPEDIIIDVKSYCLKQSRKLKRSYKIYEFIEDSLEYLASKKVKFYYESFLHNGEGISAFLVNFRKTHEKLCHKCVIKAESEMNETVSERRVLLTAILMYLEKHGLFSKNRSYA